VGDAANPAYAPIPANEAVIFGKIVAVRRGSSLIYLTPPAAMSWAYLMFGQRIGMLAAAGLVVCLIAVLIVTRAARAGAARGLYLTARKPAVGTRDR
jgi:hypothetical protein